MDCCSQQCKQPCLPPPICQQKIGIKGTPWQQRGSSHCTKPCFPSWQQSYDPKCSPAYPPQSRAVCWAQPVQQCPSWPRQPCSPPCKSVSFNPKGLSAPHGMQQSASKGKRQCLLQDGPHQCLKVCAVKGCKKCANKGSPQCVMKGSRGGLPCACQPHAVKGDWTWFIKGNQQCVSQPCVTKVNPLYSSKGSQQYGRKGGYCKTQVKVSSSGQKYCSGSNNWPW